LVIEWKAGTKRKCLRAKTSVSHNGKPRDGKEFPILNFRCPSYCGNSRLPQNICDPAPVQS
jgi:hypothetical protein